MVEGKARDVLDLEEVQGRGQVLKFQLDSFGQHGAQDQKDLVGGALHLHCIQALEQAVRLTPEKRLRICEEVYSEATMLDDSARGRKLPIQVA